MSTPWPTGLVAYPLTPVGDAGVDEASYGALVARAAAAGVDAITVLGSTGSGAYLDRDERRRAVELGVAAAGGATGVPVLAGVGALRTREVLRHVDDAQAAGARGVLVSAVSYQPLTDREVHDLLVEVCAAASVPVVVYDNPGTTRFTFSDALLGEVARLPGVAAVKIPPVSGTVEVVRARVDALRAVLPAHVGLGTSGDAAATTALLAGCDAWHSVLAGTLPGPCRDIVDAVAAGDGERALHLADRLAPLWQLVVEAGSVRVVAALAEELGLLTGPHLPRPVQGLDGARRARVREALEQLAGS